jgi:histidinol-phosphate aminotransferase
VNRYPDRDCVGLRSALATYLAHREGATVASDSIWPANGSNEVMLQLMQAFGGPGRKALGFSPTYSMYPDYCRDTFTHYVTVNRSADFAVTAEIALAAIANEQPDIILLASPNNPTGTALSLDVIETVCSNFSGMVIVDEAYAEFRRTGTPSALTLLEKFPRLIVTRTMSKAFAFAGGRVGYLVASPAVVDAVQLVRLPYHVSAITQAAAVAALENAEELLAGVDQLRTERDQLFTWLQSRGHEVAVSDANFILFGRFAEPDLVWQGLLDRGVLIRQTGPTGWLRVSIGTASEMMAFRKALEEVVPA